METNSEARIGEESYQEIKQIKNPALFDFIGKYIELCKPGNRLRFKTIPLKMLPISRNYAKSRRRKALAISGHTLILTLPAIKEETRNTPIFLFPKRLCSVMRSAPGIGRKG